MEGKGKAKEPLEIAAPYCIIRIMERIGMDRNGVDWNGKEWSGLEWKG